VSLLSRIETLDRRWLFLALAILVMEPLLKPLHLPLTISPPARDFAMAIARLPRGSTVLMSCDYAPDSKPELVPMTRTALRQLFRKNCKVIVTVLWNGGPGLVDQVLHEVGDEMHKTYGVDYLNLGYQSGNEAVMVHMGQGVANAFPSDVMGRPTLAYPIMRGVRDYGSFPLMISISAGYPGTKEWVQQVQSRFHLRMIAGVTAVSAPEFYPYLQSGQLQGLLGGMAGAAEYEILMGERGPASRGMDAQSLAHYFIAFCIVLGNLVQRRKRTEATA
jgi:hypothetical protein